jgi:hypothetical protein
MANRNFNRFQALEKEVKALYAEIDVAADGSASLVQGLGVASAELDGSGNFKITLQDKYNRLLHVSVVEVNASPLLASPVGVVSEDVAGAKTIVLSNADTLSSTTLLVRIDVKNSSV